MLSYLWPAALWPRSHVRTTGSPLKIVVIIAFVLIIASLGSALVFLMKDRGKSDRTLHALALRVGLSVALFLFLLLAYQLGWIQPTGIPVAPR